MKIERKLNLDIAGKVSELEILMKKVLPKNIMYRLLLGKGLEFDGYRDYTQTDDAANIDWKASVRGKRLFVRKYIEERDLKFMFLIDVSENMIFGSTEKLKCEYTAELAAAVSHLILGSGDRFGYALYNEGIVKFGVPSFGNKQFDTFVNFLSSPNTYGGSSNLDNVLKGFIPTLDRSLSMIFIISDFINMNESYKRNLAMLSGLFETVAIIVRDPLDKTLPDIGGEIVLEGPTNFPKLLINPRVAKKPYEFNAAAQLNLVRQMFKDLNIDFLELSTENPFSVDFTGFLKQRIMGGRVVKVKNVY
jgi:uncharacterized protein (DUF58 family)